jgi:hypothetical protein
MCLFQIMICVHVCSTWSIVELQTRFETWITKYDVSGVCLFNLIYLIILMAYQCSWRKPNVKINYFVFHWSLYRLFVLNTGWKTDSLQMMNIRICLLNIKTGSNENAFWDVNNKKWRIWYKFDGPFLFNNSYGLPVLTKGIKILNQVFYVFLYDLQNICTI